MPNRELAKKIIKSGWCCDYAFIKWHETRRLYGTKDVARMQSATVLSNKMDLSKRTIMYLRQRFREGMLKCHKLPRCMDYEPTMGLTGSGGKEKVEERKVFTEAGVPYSAAMPLNARPCWKRGCCEPATVQIEDLWFCKGHAETLDEE